MYSNEIEVVVIVNTQTQEKNMFTPEAIIDSVQNAKKQIVNTFVVNNDSFKKELIKLIDSQTEFAKGQTKTTLAIAEAFYKNATDAFYAAAKVSK